MAIASGGFEEQRSLCVQQVVSGTIRRTGSVAGVSATLDAGRPADHRGLVPRALQEASAVGGLG